MTRWDRGDEYPATWPQWLRDADIEWCDVDVSPCGVTWRDGVWRDGVWRDGVWRDGAWRDGAWRGGVWHGGEWHGGEWYGGLWRGGRWYGGEWHGGEWHGGEWHGGEWHGGDWQRRLDARGDQIAAVAVAANWHGECGRTLRLWRCPERGWLASCGCFLGTLGQLRDYIRGDYPHLRASRTRVLRSAIALARVNP